MTADLFSQPAAPARDAVQIAEAKGATWNRSASGDWIAVAHRRGRAVALASFVAGSQAEAAAMFCRYFHLKP